MAEDFVTAARDTVRNQFCNVLSVADGALNFLSDFEESMGSRATGVAPLPAEVNALIGIFCNMPPAPIPPEIPPQFTGGQCAGDEYEIIINVDRFANGQFAANEPDYGSSRLFTGPIEEIFLGSPGSKPSVRFDGGQTAQMREGNPLSITYQNISDIRIINRTNPTDECGDLPGTRPTTPPPGTDSPVPDDIVVGPPGAEVLIPVDVSFGDVNIDVNGSLNVGFNLVNPEFNLTGNLNLNTGDINFGFGGRNPSNEECCLPPTIDDDDTDETGDDDEEDTTSTIVGVLVNSVVDDSQVKATKIAQDNGPNFYNPRIANLYFKLRVEGQIFWTSPIDVKHENEYIQCPVDFGAISVVATPAEGVTLRLSPIRRNIPVTEFPT